MSMFPIASVVLSSTGSFSFTNIPQIYTHLQLRCFSRSGNYGSVLAFPADLYIRFNGDAGNNYKVHWLSGNGATASSNNSGPQSTMTVVNAGAFNDQLANVYGNAVIDILDYTNTNKYKVSKALAGTDLNGTANGTGATALSSGLWLSTAAVTSIGVDSWNGFSAGSRIDLYGLTTSSVTGA